MIQKLKRDQKTSKLALKYFCYVDIPRKAEKKERRKEEQIAAMKQAYESRNWHIENYLKTLFIVYYKR